MLITYSGGGGEELLKTSQTYFSLESANIQSEMTLILSLLLTNRKLIYLSASHMSDWE